MGVKRILAVMAACLMMPNFNIDACAAEPKEAAYEKELETIYQLPVQSNGIKGWPEGPGTYGDAAIVMEAETGAVLYAKNIEKEEYPASITKVLTALLALEYEVPLADFVTVSPDSLECLGNGYASIGLKEGDVLPLEQVLYGMLLASANEAAYVVGEGVAKSQGKTYDWFLNQMNEKIKELGGEHSNFVNTNGIHEEDHYTCAKDMALIGKELFQYPKFFEITQTPEYKIPPTDTCEEHVFQQNHEMLVEGYDAYYEYVVGGKTGYTTEANNTLITLADNGEMQLICVIFQTYAGHVYTDTRNLLDYGFDNFSKVAVTEETRTQAIQSIENGSIILPKNLQQSDMSVSVVPEEKNSARGTLLYTYKKMVTGEVPVTLKNNYKEKVEQEQKEPQKVEDRIWKQVVVIALAIVVILGMWLLVISSKRKKKQKNRCKSRKNP